MDKKELLPIFLEDVFERLQEFSNILLAFEHDLENAEHIQTLFICVHTLKGNSATVYSSFYEMDPHDTILPHIEKMTELSHVLEDLVSEVRDRGMKMTANEIDLLLECEETLESLVRAIQAESDEDIHIDTMIETLRETIANRGATQEKKPVLEEKKISGEKYILEMEVEDFKHAYLHLAFQDIGKKYSNITTFPSQESIMNGEDFERAHVYINDDHDQTEAITFMNELENIKSVSHVSEKMTLEEPAKVTPVAPSSLPKKETDMLHTTQVRVSVDRIDKVLKYVSNIVILNNKLLSYQNDLPKEEFKMLRNTMDEISQTVFFLQESVMAIRMTPLDHLFGRFPVMVRKTASHMNKRVHFKFDAKNTEIDKSLLDDLGHPLTHIIRNSISHGMESEEERVALGKNPIGTISLTAQHEQNFVIITIEDDGAGIDVENVTEKAIEKGLLTREKAQALTDTERVNLIFHPGLSTATEVTEVSGRGVGMDAVRTVIEGMKGTIDIQTEKNKGTTITIQLPITLAIIKAMLTKVDNEVYAFPSSQVQFVDEIHQDNIKYVANKEIYIYKKEEIPIIRLREFFKIKPNREDDKLRIVILKTGNRTVAVVVDEFMHHEDIVAKNLGPYLGSLPGIGGCNVLGNGDISLIVDVNSLTY